MDRGGAGLGGKGWQKGRLILVCGGKRKGEGHGPSFCSPKLLLGLRMIKMVALREQILDLLSKFFEPLGSQTSDPSVGEFAGFGLVRSNN